MDREDRYVNYLALQDSVEIGSDSVFKEVV